MKKAVLFLVVALMCVSCKKMGDERLLYWHIENDTEQTLTLKYPYYRFINHKNREWEYRESELAPGKSVVIGCGWVQITDDQFDYYFKKCSEKFGEDMIWQVLTEDGTVLKVWNYSDRDMPDQRFFDGSAWHSAVNEQGLGSLWSFEISPEDIE